MTENEIGTIVVGTAIEVHRELGPGLLESVYEVVLAHELSLRGLEVKRQVPIAIVYKGIEFAEAFRADLLVADKVIVELKSVEQINKAHRKQIQTYLRLTGLKLGYIFNFGAALMKEGIVRAVNGLEEERSDSRRAPFGRNNNSRRDAEALRKIKREPFPNPCYWFFPCCVAFSFLSVFLCASASLRENELAFLLVTLHSSLVTALMPASIPCAVSSSRVPPATSGCFPGLPSDDA